MKKGNVINCEAGRFVALNIGKLSQPAEAW
jgi:hypothetical protein